MNDEYFRGTEEAVRAAANKEEMALRYCFSKAFESDAEDADIWERIAYHVIPFRSRAFYEMDAEKAVKDANRIYETDTLDEAFSTYKGFCRHYHKTPVDLVNGFYSKDALELEAYIKANYIPA